MAANDYFNQKPLPDHNAPSYSGYYTGQPAASSSAASTYSTPAPPYSAQPPQHQQQHLAPGGGRTGVSPSPFETVFDDHVYPASTHMPTPSSSMHRLSHHDTGYHSPSPVSPTDDTAYSNRPVDDIPLQDHAQRMPGKDAEMQDHVYDASGAPRKKQRKARVRFGELGMMGSGRKKIPLVVYFFTIVQIAVFIGEIVKNCEQTALPAVRESEQKLTPPVPPQPRPPAPPS